MNAFDLVADADAPSAEDASVSVDYQEVVGGVDFFAAPVTLEHDVVDAELVSHGCPKCTLAPSSARNAHANSLGNLAIIRGYFPLTCHSASLTIVSKLYSASLSHQLFRIYSSVLPLIIS